MQIHKSCDSKSILKRQKAKNLLPFFLLMFCISCAKDPSKYGRVTLHSSTEQNSFIFSVSDDFVKENVDSARDKDFPRMTQAENKLLYALLKQKQYCLDASGDPAFTVTSRQEKIYDMTFAHLIEQNYNARSLTPRMYFGQCKKE